MNEQLNATSISGITGGITTEQGCRSLSGCLVSGLIVVAGVVAVSLVKVDIDKWTEIQCNLVTAKILTDEVLNGARPCIVPAPCCFPISAVLAVLVAKLTKLRKKIHDM